MPTDTPAAQSSGLLTISDWVATEFSSVLSIKLRSGHLSPDDRAGGLSLFTELAAASLDVLPVSRAQFRALVRLADQHTFGLRAGDALHLAVCADLGATLCTLDHRLLEAAPLIGVRTLAP